MRSSPQGRNPRPEGRKKIELPKPEFGKGHGLSFPELVGRLSDHRRSALLQYSRFLVMPGIGTGYLPSGPALRGDGELMVS